MMSLNCEKLALVTANSRGIGKSISDLLRKEYIVPEISRTFGYDLMKDGIDKLISKYPECNVIINNCGGMGRSKQADWADCMQKNYGVTFQLTMHYLPQMIKKQFGRVITISSIHGIDCLGLPWFNATKSAQIALNCSLAERYKDSGVTFNTICPGQVNIREGDNYHLNPLDIAHICLNLIKSNQNGRIIKLV